MLNLLTKYLLQYRNVSIPSVGTIQLVQQPPQLNIADKLLLPPTFKAELAPEEAVSDHQLAFLSATLQQDVDSVRQSLAALGSQLKQKMKKDGLDWKGIGLLRSGDGAVDVSLSTLEPVPAHRVLRHDAEHNVLVGDQQMTSTQINELKEGGEEREEVENKRSLFIIFAWILLVLAIVYAALMIYQGKFRLGSTGSKYKSTSYQQPTVPHAYYALSNGSV